MGNFFSTPAFVHDTVLSHFWNAILRQLNYTQKLEENLNAMKAELDKLKTQRDDLKRAVDRAENQLMKRSSQVQLWLSRVQIVVAEADELIKDSPQVIRKLHFPRCFSGDYNYISSYKFGKQVVGKLEEIVDLKNGGDFDKVAEDEPVPPVDVRPTEPTVGLESKLAKVWRLLEGNDAGIIGLHGMGGIGKTTLLTQINNKLSYNLLSYDVVIWVVVSKDYTIEKVQEKICRKLGLPSKLWMNINSDDKAILISRVLSKRKFVILMDDVWERVDLIRVGIPTPNQDNFCKLIFTTRFLEVCGQMGAHKKIKVECLGDDNAWKLFQEKVGEENLDSHIRKLAKQVAAKCGGLPLALITVGRAMACKKMPQDWKYAIEVLKEFPHKLARMDQEVYSLLKFSYDSLPNDTMRSCLLYCSLYKEDCVISKHFLIDRWFCEGFLDEFDNISRARMQGHNIINCLVNACLLETCEGLVESIKMHDVIRDMALWIASECEAPEKKFFLQTGGRIGSVEAMVDVENWEGSRMSLAIDEIEELRGTPVCSNLQTLFIESKKLKVISDGFFQFMRHLRVLNLSFNLKLRELPKGVSELGSLECLDLSCTGIIELPMHLIRLSKLKCLNLAATPYLKKIPRQLICNISRLQIFRISLSDENLDELDETNVLKGGNEDLVEELECLQHLDMVVIELKSVFALECFLSSHRLVRCTELLSLSGFRKSKELNVLPLVNMERLEEILVRDCESIEEIKVKMERDQLGEEKSIQSSVFPTPCFHTLNRVSIGGCDGLKDLTWLVLAPNLRWLNVILCSKLEEILSESKMSELGVAVIGSPFAKLETLHLGDLPRLKRICQDALTCLKQIKVLNCSNLKKLPLKLDRVKGNQISIEGYQEWWDALEWEDEVTRNSLLPSFKCARRWKDIALWGEDCEGQRSVTFSKQAFVYFVLFYNRNFQR